MIDKLFKVDIHAFQIKFSGVQFLISHTQTLKIDFIYLSTEF